MIIRIIKSTRYIVAVCDSELIGKKFEEGRFQLDVKENFFLGKDGKEANEEETIETMQEMEKEDATFYIAGEKSVNSALKAGIIEQEGIKRIQGIPFTIILL
jgi:hypothetical protein